MSCIVIVEDEGLIAADLAAVVQMHTGAEPMVVASVAEALRAVAEGCDFAFLDVNVLDGSTFEFARLLAGRGIPFAFTSGSRRSDVPADLRSEVFVSKPCKERELIAALDAGLGRNTARRGTAVGGR